MIDRGLRHGLGHSEVLKNYTLPLFLAIGIFEKESRIDVAITVDFV